MKRSMLCAGLMCLSSSDCAAKPAPLARAEQVSISTFSLKVNYSLPIEWLAAQGKYDSVDELIRILKSDKKGEADLVLELISFKKAMWPKEVFAEFGKRGLRPVDIHELLTFGAEYPGEQLKYPILTFSALKYADATIVVELQLYEFEGKRIVGLEAISGRGEEFRFLAVRE